MTRGGGFWCQLYFFRRRDTCHQQLLYWYWLIDSFIAAATATEALVLSDFIAARPTMGRLLSCVGLSESTAACVSDRQGAVGLQRRICGERYQRSGGPPLFLVFVY